MDTLLSAEELLRHGSSRCAESGLAKGVCFKPGKFDLMVFNGKLMVFDGDVMMGLMVNEDSMRV